MYRKLLSTAFAVSLFWLLLPITALGAPTDCFGQRPTITGRGGDDVLKGTPGDDVIAGRGGDDVISGLGGSDLICGEGGVDKISGGAGDDGLSGGEGPGEEDIVRFKGASGVVVDLEAGTARGQGRDALQGFEIVVGSSGDDVMRGAPAFPFETFRGKGGEDRLVAESQQTSMFGGAGHDTLIGGPGEDDFFPGPGNDTINGAGSGLDVLMYWFSARRVRVDVAAGTVTGEGTDTIRELDVIFGSHHDDVMLGSRGPDGLNGDVGDDLIRGRGGNDVLVGDIDNDRIFGGAGDDRLDGHEQRDRLDGGTGTDECINGEEVTTCE